MKIYFDYLSKLNENKKPAKRLKESNKRMSEDISSDDIVESFKKFLKEYYTDYRDQHKNDIRFLSALKQDLGQLIDMAVRDFWFE